MFNKIQDKLEAMVNKAIRGNGDVEKLTIVLEYIAMGICLIAGALAFLIVILVSRIGGPK